MAPRTSKLRWVAEAAPVKKTKPAKAIKTPIRITDSLNIQPCGLGITGPAKSRALGPCGQDPAKGRRRRAAQWDEPSAGQSRRSVPRRRDARRCRDEAG